MNLNTNKKTIKNLKDVAMNEDWNVSFSFCFCFISILSFIYLSIYLFIYFCYEQNEKKNILR